MNDHSAATRRRKLPNRNRKQQQTNLNQTNLQAEAGQIFQPLGTKAFQPVEPHILARQLELQFQIQSHEAAEVSYILYHILSFPSKEEADTHSLANRLGAHDLNKQQQTAHNQQQEAQSKQYCKCCGYVKQEKQVPLCTPLDSFPSVGISTYLFFETIKNLIYLLLFVFLVFGLYSLLVNLYLAGLLNETFTASSITLTWLISWGSLYSKISADSPNARYLYIAEMWIGVGLVVLWSLLIYLIRYYERKYEVMVDNNTISAADFSIIIENYPDELSQEALQKQLNAYGRTIEEGLAEQDMQIVKISLSADPRLKKQDEEEMEGINQKYNNMLEMFADWVIQLHKNGSLPLDLPKRMRAYQKFHKIKYQRFVKGRRLLKTMFKVDEQSNQNIQKRKVKRIAIVTFKYNRTKDILDKYNSMDIAKYIRYVLGCCQSRNKLVIMDHNKPKAVPYKGISIGKAPEPEDIKWDNLTVSQCEKFLRKTATYLITMLLLGASFAIVYFLSAQERKNSSNFTISILISITISSINFLISFLISLLTVFEKDYTITEYQTSLAVKSICAQLLNSIVIPIIVNYIIESQNIYGAGGLAVDVVYLGLINSFLMPLAKIFDPYFRFVLVRAYFYRRNLKERLLINQVKLNDSQQLMQFETGYEYIYFINLYLFTAFFVTLQPCICIFTIIGMISMYWIEKYALLNRMRRPVPGTDLINIAMGQMVSLGPIFFALGALCWSHILQITEIEIELSSFTPNIVAGALAAVFFVFPFSIIFDRCMPKDSEEENIEYDECRVLMNSEYDRVNPATMQKAIRQYEEYLQKRLKEDQDKKGAAKTEVSELQQLNSIENIIKLNQVQEPGNKLSNFKRKTVKKLCQVPKHGNNGIVNGQPVNKEFLNRKIQLLRNHGRLRSKLGQEKISNMVGDFLGRYTKKQSQLEPDNNNSDWQQQVQDLAEADQIKQQDPEPGERTPNVLLGNTNETDSQRPLGVNLQDSMPDKSADNNEATPKVLKNSESSFNQQPTLIKICKSSEPSPSKLKLDFRSFFPTAETTQNFFQSSSAKSRNDGYVNFFGKSSIMGNEISARAEDKRTQRKRQADKYNYNPFEKSFGS